MAVIIIKHILVQTLVSQQSTAFIAENDMGREVIYTPKSEV
jgi:hypothetical protein